MTDPVSIFSHLHHLLRNIYFFQSMQKNELDDLIWQLRAIRVQKGFEIIRQGDPGDAFYLIASGKVSVWLQKDFKRVKVAELLADDFFGEMALISNEPRNATIIAEEITELFILEKHNFEEILLKNPAIARELNKTYQQRKEKNLFPPSI